MQTSSVRAIGQLLRLRNLTLAVAESCTGGLLAGRITDAPGASDYFAGGVVTYSNRAKHALLHVSMEILTCHGAVSEETARAMATGVRELFHADVTMAITGIAGPGGGTRQKPVGLVYIALATEEHSICRKHLWAGDRRRNRENSVLAALEMLHAHLVQGPRGQDHP